MGLSKFEQDYKSLRYSKLKDCDTYLPGVN